MEKSERKSKKKRKHKLEELRPMASYVSDRPALLSQLFSALPKDKMLAMLPPVLRDVPHDELRADCLEILLGLSARRICSILRGEQLGSSSSSETDSQSEKSREPSPNGQHLVTSAPEQASENCSLLEIVELQLRARAIRAALSHGEADSGKQHPPPPLKSITPPVVTPENVSTGTEIEAESAVESVVEPEVVRAKKRPVLVGPLKRLGKRVLLTVNNGSSSTQSLAEENCEKLEDEASIRDDKVNSSTKGRDKEAYSAVEAKVPETIQAEPETVDFVGPEPATYCQANAAEPGTALQDATWVDRRLQQAASPTLRSSLIGTTRQRLANNDTAADLTSLAKGNQSETSLVVHGPDQVDANEGSVTQYDSLASNALDIEPLVLLYEED